MPRKLGEGRRAIRFWGQGRKKERPATRPVLEALEDRLALATAHFAVIGDYGSAGPAEQSVANLVNSWKPDFIITTGDNNYSSTPSVATYDQNVGQYYHGYISPYTGAYGAGATVNSFFPTLGEHDWNSPPDGAYLKFFTLPGNGRYYSVKQGPVDLFALDSDQNEPDGTTSTSTQATWLKNQLAASTAPWKLVYCSHPPYSSGAVHGSTSWMQWPFQTWGASAVLSGHDHEYERLNVNGLPYFVNGLGGASIYSFGTPLSTSQVRYNGDYGAMLVDASDTQITFQFINEAGQLIDRYTLNGTSLPPPTVSVAATDATASEPGTDTGTLTFSRTGGTSTPLAVNYTVGGTATAGSDYVALPGTVTIPAGASSATVTVTPLDDTLVERTETVTVSLASSTAYNFGSPSSATVSIADNDSAGLLAAGSTWKYLDKGSNQGTAWQAPGFNDSTWASGPAQLGYGDGDEATVVGYGPNASNKYVTTYFRTSFAVTNPAVYNGLTLWLLRDDGAVVYLNGTELVRSNMPTGAITYTTLASTTVAGADESTWYQYSVPAGALVAGTNVLAVEIHQSDVTSSDISFDLELRGNTFVPPAPSSLTASAASVSQINLAWADNSPNEDGFKVERSPDGVTWAQVATTGPNVTTYADTGLSAGTVYWYRVRAGNATGDSAYSNTASATTLTGGPSLGITAQSGSVTAGTSFTVTVTARDGQGNVATGYRGTVHFSSSDAPAVLPGDYTFTAVDNGQHTFDVTLKTAGGQTVTAADTVTSSLTGSTTITVNPAVASKLVFTTAAQALTAGVSSGVMTVQLQDAYGNAVGAAAAQVVGLATTSAAGTFRNAADTTAITGVTVAAGTSTASFRYRDTAAGTPTLTASAAGLASATQAETVNPGAASRFVFTTAAQALTAGVSSGVMTVQLQDAYGNAVSAAAAQAVSLATTSAGGTFRDAADTTAITGVTVAAGTSTASFRYRDTAAGTPTLTASAAGLTSATQAEAVRAAAASGLRISAPAGTASGSAFNVTVAAVDAYGNVATDYRGTVRLGSSDAQAVLPGDYAFTAGDNGQHTFAVTLKTLGTQSLTATDVLTGSLAAGSATVTVNPVAPTNLTATVPATGGSSTINLTWLDNSSNETGFQIWRSTDGVNWTLVTTVGPDVNNYTDTGLRKNTKYYYRVRAVSTSPVVYSDYSNVASAKTRRV
jgi:tartrate-resistant acid phosphatase type 5